jgi:hypothetical protein
MRTPFDKIDPREKLATSLPSEHMMRDHQNFSRRTREDENKGSGTISDPEEACATLPSYLGGGR